MKCLAGDQKTQNFNGYLSGLELTIIYAVFFSHVNIFLKHPLLSSLGKSDWAKWWVILILIRSKCNSEPIRVFIPKILQITIRNAFASG